MVKILALDLSTKSSGYCIFENGEVVDHGVIESHDKDFLVRCHYMAEFIRLLCEKHGKFNTVVIEELKVIHNQKTLVILGILQGMVLRELHTIPVEFIMPSVWRKTFGLNGKRSEAKEKAIKLCEQLGYTVCNDDDAEAILLGKHFVDKKD